MARVPRSFMSFADFEREEIRPELRIGWSCDEIEATGEELDFDLDPFEASLWAAENEDKSDE